MILIVGQRERNIRRYGEVGIIKGKTKKGTFQFEEKRKG